MKHNAEAHRTVMAMIHHRHDPAPSKKQEPVYTFNNKRKCDDCGENKLRSAGSWFNDKWYCFDCAS